MCAPRHLKKDAESAFGALLNCIIQTPRCQLRLSFCCLFMKHSHLRFILLTIYRGRGCCHSWQSGPFTSQSGACRLPGNPCSGSPVSDRPRPPSMLMHSGCAPMRSSSHAAWGLRTARRCPSSRARRHSPVTPHCCAHLIALPRAHRKDLGHKARRQAARNCSNDPLSQIRRVGSRHRHLRIRTAES